MRKPSKPGLREWFEVAVFGTATLGMVAVGTAAQVLPTPIGHRLLDAIERRIDAATFGRAARRAAAR